MFDDLVPELRPYARELVNAAGRAGLQPRVTSTRRSYSKQASMYRDYLAGRRRYPVAPPGTSSHETGRAFDMIVTPYDALYTDVGPYWEAMGGFWGGRINDEIHFELPRSAFGGGRSGGGGAGGSYAAPKVPEESIASSAAHAAVDAVIALIPGMAAVEIAATVLQWFPWFAESEILAVLASPSKALF